MDDTTLEILAGQFIECFHKSKNSGNIEIENVISDFFLREGLCENKATNAVDLTINGYKTTPKGNQLISDCFSKIDSSATLSRSMEDAQYLKEHIVTDIRDYNHANIRSDLKERYSESIKEHMAKYPLFVSKELALTPLAKKLIVSYEKGLRQLEIELGKMNPPNV